MIVAGFILGCAFMLAMGAWVAAQILREEGEAREWAVDAVGCVFTLGVFVALWIMSSSL